MEDSSNQAANSNNNPDGGQGNEQGFLMFVAENSGIRPADLELLFYNGFDNPESFSLVQADELRALGVSEEPIDLYDKIQATMEVYRDYVSNNGPYVSREPGYGQ